ncbi:bifunctional histidinol-phosphatase/imidazoleglycerol-phosphate dehydratase HisB [Robertkochia marina]|uniref:Histidine biosynthesis bifunctional protein HisB n=1 Tax=Robertkochia marina TaxID=1227945 RepID=A0A4S3M349_9FLAO|nr:bifunctional histidinol-phosphatase/imidazoleglycerol-phosphate dehydratase HisB [Robertkochia marina]THD67925.1 bifunctional histidinol-phosphatase/imidazoleglycerol-phosphate dehydratase HisB [Robertkochia marina]TRZ41031.1 bifunctional histidinol-phosphatase/imidazoleglycerol-phosphate dehydratase HisB [Robertkochia marina]
MKKILFIDRDGTLIKEPEDEQIDSLDKLDFLPGVLTWLSRLCKDNDYELVMVTNQDGLGTEAYPEEVFWPIQNFIMRTLESEGINFREVVIDKTFPEENSPNRKPNTGALTAYMNGDFDLENSYVIGDRLTDVKLAENLGCKAIFIENGRSLGNHELNEGKQALLPVIALETENWEKIYQFLTLGKRTATIERTTKETDIRVTLDLDGTGRSKNQTGIAFFDHMLDQLGKHGLIDLEITVNGDLEVDEHHTIEDTAIALGEAFARALGDKRGIERYGYYLPMDDALASVALDFGGRQWLEWDAEFKREMIGKMPTEMFKHFFKSFSDGAKANLNIKAEGENEHHKIEAIFKAFAKAIKMAVRRDPDRMILPSTKGML